MILPRASSGERSSTLAGVSARTGAEVEIPANRSAQTVVRSRLACGTAAKSLGGRRRAGEVSPALFRSKSRSDLVMPVAVSHRCRRTGTTLGARRLAGLQLRDTLAVLLPVLRPVGEQDAFAHPLGLRHARDSSPKHERLVSVAKGAGVKVLVPVHFLVGPRETQPTPEELDVLRLSGEELPALARPESLDVAAQHLGRIVLRVERDRIHGQIPPDTIAKHLLNAHEVGCSERTGRLAARVHHVDGHELVLDEIVVEADLLAFVSDEYDIG